MHTKTLTGEYPAGYSLSSDYSILKLTASAFVGGTGIEASAPAHIKNHGTIEAGSTPGTRGPGYTAVSLGGDGSVANFGLIAGGNAAEKNGDGGTGIYLRSGEVTNRGTITGGAATSASHVVTQGGMAVEIENAGSVNNIGVITGGAGGGVGFTTAGAGGDAISISSGAVTNVGTITGGSAAGYGADSGGSGGTAVEIGASGSVVNTGSIGGGAGGGGEFDYVGGVGGAGVSLGGGLVDNGSGTIVGGAGGPGGVERIGHYFYYGAGGTGGSGVQSTAHVNLNNTGLVQGGAGGNDGGTGGTGITAKGGTIQNFGSFAGGVGGGAGGVGGVGLNLTALATVINAGVVIGGAGGFGTGEADAYVGGEGGSGVLLVNGGSIANQSGEITGGAAGAGGINQYQGYGASGGYGGSGVVLMAAGSLANLGGDITGGAGGLSGYDPGSNYNRTGGAGGAGVRLQAGGLVTNTGTIEGGEGGAGGGGTAQPGADGSGVTLTSGGAVVNGGSASSAALIEGAVGVVAAKSGAATVTNYGTIEGTTGVSVKFASASDILVAETGAVFLGTAQGGGGMLQLAGGTGSITGLGSGGTVSGAMSLGFGGFGFYQLDAGGVWTVTGATTLAATQRLVDFATAILDGSVTNAGTIRAATGGDLVIAAALENDGAVIANGVLTVEGQVTGAGVADINGGTLNFLSTFNQAVDFLGAGKLGLSDSQGYTGQVTGFSVTGATALDLADIGFVGVDEATFSGTVTGGVLTVTDGAHTTNINLLGNYLSATFVTISDGHGGTDVTATSPQSPSVTHFVGAMAAMTGRGMSPGLPDAHANHEGRQSMLSAPRLALA